MNPPYAIGQCFTRDSSVTRPTHAGSSEVVTTEYITILKITDVEGEYVAIEQSRNAERPIRRYLHRSRLALELRREHYEVMG